MFHGWSVLGPGFIVWTKRYSREPSIQTTDDFMSLNRLEGIQPGCVRCVPSLVCAFGGIRLRNSSRCDPASCFGISVLTAPSRGNHSSGYNQTGIALALGF